MAIGLARVPCYRMAFLDSPVRLAIDFRSAPTAKDVRPEPSFLSQCRAVPQPGLDIRSLERRRPAKGLDGRTMFESSSVVWLISRARRVWVGCPGRVKRLQNAGQMYRLTVG